MRRGVWEKFRAALCISGGNRRRPPTRSPTPRRCGGRQEGGVGEGQGEDLLSALADDVLLLVLVRLPSAAAAARTSVLSRRWRRLWAHLTELRFPDLSDLVQPRAALAAFAAPALRLLHIVATDADAGDVAAVLRLAAPRLTGEIAFHEVLPKDVLVPHQSWTAGDVELPCFEKAQRIDLRLGYLRFALPPSGVFAKLRVLRLCRVRFHGPRDLGDGLSSVQWPSLRELRVYDVLGVSYLAIRSESLVSVDLRFVHGLQQLSIVAPRLRTLSVYNCFRFGTPRQPVADISAPVLKWLLWVDSYDMSSVQLGELPQLRILGISCVVNYEYPYYYPGNWDPMMLLRHFRKIPILNLCVTSTTHVMDLQYLANVFILLPHIEELQLSLQLFSTGHAFGFFEFHLLRTFSGIRKLKLEISEDTKAETICPHGYVCHLPENWKTEELYLNSLEEVEICQLRGSERARISETAIAMDGSAQNNHLGSRSFSYCQ